MSIISSGIKKVENLANFTEHHFNSGVTSVIDVVKENIEDMLKFILNRNIVQMGVGLIIASNVGKITTSVTDFIISPIVNRFTNGQIKDVEKYTIEIAGIEFKVGALMLNIINFILTIIVLYYIWRLTQLTSFDFIKDLLEGIKPQEVKTVITLSAN